MDRSALRNFLILTLVYSIVLLFIGRQLTFLPHIDLSVEKKVEAPDLRKGVLENILKKEPGSYSVYYKDLKTGTEFGIDEDKVLTAASINKLPIVAYLYNQASNGKINPEETVIIQKEDIQDYGTGSIRYGGEGQSYSLKALAKLSLEQSDNTAAHVLGVRLDTDSIQKYVDGFGFVSTNMINNTTTAAETGKLLEAIYTRKVANESLTRELLDFMRDTDIEDRIPRDLPKNVIVYHKTGDGIGFIHDAGIVVPPAGGGDPFVLAVLTSDIKDEDGAKQTIGKIAAYLYKQK
ncbi:MAG TPA: serine hydrolase [Patescibacteria group bacterium]|nr:serine hydrolase [Patescibacteria group bacterium]